MFQTVLGQLYQLGIRGFLALRLRSQHLLRDHVADQLAGARDQFVVDDPRVERRRASRSPNRRKPPSPNGRPRRSSRRGAVSRSHSPSTFQPASPMPSAECGRSCSTPTSIRTQTPGTDPDQGVDRSGEGVSAPDSPPHQVG